VMQRHYGSREPEPEPESSTGSSDDDQDDEQARREVEKAQIQALDKTKKVQHWFIIDAEWLQEWRSYVQGGKRPGPINNAHMLEANSSGVYVARAGLTKAHDYRAVNDRVWAFFQRAYGGGPTLARGKVDIYSMAHWDVAPKSRSEQARIERVIRQRNCVLPAAVQDAEVRQQVIDAMLPVEREAGELLMRQGEAEADYYIIDDGQCTMELVQQKGNRLLGGKQMVPLPLGPGDEFGHMHTDEPWGNAVVAESDVRLWHLPRAACALILRLHRERIQQGQRQEMEGFLKKVRLLDGVGAGVLHNVLDELELTQLSEGEVIAPAIGAGQIGFIMSGKLDVLGGKSAVAASQPARTAGDYIGEGGIVKHAPAHRYCPVKGAATVRLCVLPVSKFEAAVG
jgi:CRP-like cAMP-binding protein